MRGGAFIFLVRRLGGPVVGSRNHEHMSRGWYNEWKLRGRYDGKGRCLIIRFEYTISGPEMSL